MNPGTILDFDRGSLLERLGAMSRSKRSLFAACCAERLFPFLEEYSQAAKADVSAFRNGLDLVWSAPFKDSVKVEKQFVDALFAAIPDEDMAADANVPYALEAGAAIVYALRTQSDNDPQDAAWAAESSYNVVDSIAQDQLHTDFSIAGAEGEVLQHAAVQNELSRQLNDLSTLERTTEKQLSDAALILKKRAKIASIRREDDAS
jgi:uncharacterized protein YjaG (DUF416 family)